MADKLVEYAPSEEHKAIFDAAVEKAHKTLAMTFGSFLGHCDTHGFPTKVACAALNQWMFASLCKLTLAACDVPLGNIPKDVPSEIAVAMQEHLGMLLMDVMKDIRRRESSSN